MSRRTSNWLLAALAALAALGGFLYLRHRAPAPPPPTGFPELASADEAADAPVVSIALSGVETSEVVTPSEARRRGWDLTGQFRVTPRGLLLVRSGGMIFNVLTGEGVLDSEQPGLGDFCVAGDGIVAVNGDWLCAYEGRALKPVMRLPSARMSLASGGDDVIYLYGRAADGTDIYAVYAGGDYQKVLHVEEPVLAVAASAGSLYFSVWGRILRWREGEGAVALADLGEAAPVTSLAADEEGGLLYFAAGEGVFTLDAKSPLLVLAGVTGDLEFSDGLLFVKDRRERTIIAASGLREAVARARLREDERRAAEAGEQTQADESETGGRSAGADERRDADSGAPPAPTAQQPFQPAPYRVPPTPFLIPPTPYVNRPLPTPIQITPLRPPLPVARPIPRRP